MTALITRPGLVVPLRPPQASELADLGHDLAAMSRGHNPRTLGLALEVQLPEGPAWGVGRLVAVEGGLRPGSTLVAGLHAEWTTDEEEAEFLVARLHADAVQHLAIAPEASKPEWPTVVMLLGNATLEDEAPPDWQRQLTIAAGVHAVRLTIRQSPDSSRAGVVKHLRTDPPHALLVWDGGVAAPTVYTQPYLTAQRNGYAQTFGGPGQAALADHVRELLMHLRAVAPLRGVQPADDVNLSWEQVAAEVDKLMGRHFVLTSRAQAMLADNPYPKPERMLEHLKGLERLAKRYHEAGGQLGASLSELAQTEHGIEIAMTDSGLKAPKLAEYNDLVAEPHVKVDDYKKPNACGRIYFTLDKTGARFIVDHVGLHDYK